MINYYLVLGLNNTGLNSKNNPYTVDEIKKAHRKKALKYHPDKNPEGLDAFRRIQEAYEHLSDDQKRADFDEWLRANPNTLQSSMDLIIEFDVDVHDEDGDENDSQAIIVKPQTAVCFSQLLESANCSPDAILNLAKIIPGFCYVVLENASVLERLPLPYCFELIFTLVSHQKNCSQTLSENAQQNYDMMLNALKHGSPNYSTYVDAFVSVCLKKKELALLFFQAHPEVLKNLQQHTLFILSHHFYEVFILFLTHHTVSLDAYNLYLFFKKYSQHRNDIVNHCKELNLHRLLEREEVGRQLVEHFKTNNNHYDIVSHTLDILGFEILQFGQSIPLIFNYCFINAFLNKAHSYLKTKEASAKLFSNIERTGNLQLFTEATQRGISISNAILGIKSIGNIDNYENQVLHQRLFRYPIFFSEILNRLDFKSRASFFSCFPSIFDSILREQYNEILLSNTFFDSNSDSSKSFLVELIKSRPYYCYEFLIENKSLLVALSKQEQCIQELTDNILFTQRFAHWAVRLELSQTLLSLTPLFTEIYNAFNILYNHIDLKEKDKTIKPINTNDFYAAIQLTGFFSDLMLLNTDSIGIQFSILGLTSSHKKAIEKMTYDQKQSLLNMLWDTCKKSTIAQCHQLLKLFSEHVLIKIYEVPEYYNKFFENLQFLSLIEKESYWIKNNITGALITRYLHACDTQELYNPFYVFDEAPWEEKSPFYELRNQIKSCEDPKEKQALQQKFINTFKLKLQEKYPECIFNSYLKFIESPIYQQKAAAYQRLEKRLTEIGQQSEHQDTDTNLVELLTLLENTGIDEDTIKYVLKTLNASVPANSSDSDVATSIGLFTESLFNKVLNNKDFTNSAPEITPLNQNSHQALRATLITLILESPRQFYLTEKVSQLLSKHTVQEDVTYQLATQFVTLAKHLIQKKRKNIHGDLLIALYSAHGDQLIPIIELYGLRSKLILGKKLARSIDAIQSRSSITFKNTTIKPAETLNQLFDILHQFILKALFQSPIKLTHEMIETCHAEILLSYNEQVTHPALSGILDSYSLLLEQKISDYVIASIWLFELALHNNSRFGDLSKQILLTSDVEIDNIIYWINHQKVHIDVNTLQNAFGENVLLRIIERHISQFLLHNSISTELIRQLYTIMQQNKLQLRSFFSFNTTQIQRLCSQASYLSSRLRTAPILNDDNLFSISVEKFPIFLLFDQHILAGTKILTNIELQLYTQLCASYDFSAKEESLRSKVMLIKNYFESNYLTLLISNILKPLQEENTHSDIQLIIEQCVINAITQATALSLNCTSMTQQLHKQLLEKLEADRIIEDIKKIEKIALFLNLSGLSSTNIMNLPFLQLDSNKAAFLPLLAHDIMSLEKINALTTNSLEYRLLEKKCLIYSQQLISQQNASEIENSSMENTINLTALNHCIENSKKIHSFCQSSYFNFLKNNILDVIELEISRLDKDHGAKKALQLLQFNKDIQDDIVDLMSEEDLPMCNNAQIFKKIQTRLNTKLSHIIDDPLLSKPRDPIKFFFKKLMGTLLTPLVFTPLLSKNYYLSFFHTKTTYNLMNMNASVKNYTHTN